MLLLDVVIGIETGASPFDSPGPISVYSGLGDSEVAHIKVSENGGKPGSAHAYPDPAVPYIYLPPGTCEEAAKHFPIFLDSDLEIYLWNISNPQFERIVTSSAYFVFVFSDQTPTEIKIKVPFPLLNLNLTAPLAEEPTAYFPCKTFGGGLGTWCLSRAFLQAAFYAVKFDAGVAFLAPGARSRRGSVGGKSDGRGWPAARGARD